MARIGVVIQSWILVTPLIDDAFNPTLSSRPSIGFTHHHEAIRSRVTMASEDWRSQRLRDRFYGLNGEETRDASSCGSGIPIPITPVSSMNGWLSNSVSLLSLLNPPNLRISEDGMDNLRNPNPLAILLLAWDLKRSHSLTDGQSRWRPIFSL